MAFPHTQQGFTAFYQMVYQGTGPAAASARSYTRKNVYHTLYTLYMIFFHLSVKAIMTFIAGCMHFAHA